MAFGQEDSNRGGGREARRFERHGRKEGGAFASLPWHTVLVSVVLATQGQAQHPTASATRRKIHNLFCLPPLLLATVLPDPAIPITRTPPTTLPATVWSAHTLKSDDVVRSRQNGRHWEKGNSPTSRARPLCVRLSSIVGLMVHEDELKAARAYRRGDRAMYRSGIWSQ